MKYLIGYLNPKIEKDINQGKYYSVEDYCNQEGKNYDECYTEKWIFPKALDKIENDYFILNED